MLYVDNNLHLF